MEIMKTYSEQSAVTSDTDPKKKKKYENEEKDAKKEGPNRVEPKLVKITARRRMGRNRNAEKMTIVNEERGPFSSTIESLDLGFGRAERRVADGMPDEKNEHKGKSKNWKDSMGGCDLDTVSEITLDDRAVRERGKVKGKGGDGKHRRKKDALGNDLEKVSKITREDQTDKRKLKEKGWDSKDWRKDAAICDLDAANEIMHDGVDAKEQRKVKEKSGDGKGKRIDGKRMPGNVSDSTPDEDDGSTELGNDENLSEMLGKKKKKEIVTDDTNIKGSGWKERNGDLEDNTDFGRLNKRKKKKEEIPLMRVEGSGKRGILKLFMILCVERKKRERKGMLRMEKAVKKGGMQILLMMEVRGRKRGRGVLKMILLMVSQVRKGGKWIPMMILTTHFQVKAKGLIPKPSSSIR